MAVEGSETKAEDEKKAAEDGASGAESCGEWRCLFLFLVLVLGLFLPKNS